MNVMRNFIKYICYILYYWVAIYLPSSNLRFDVGAKAIRGFLTSRIIIKAGLNINIDKGAKFSTKIVIGNNSGIGNNCVIQGPTTIGNDVMMGPEVLIYTTNHNHRRIDVPMNTQGNETPREVIIGNDCWIGARVIILPGVRIGDGVIIGAGSVVSRNIEPYSIVVGNPAQIVKKRI